MITKEDLLIEKFDDGVAITVLGIFSIAVIMKEKKYFIMKYSLETDNYLFPIKINRSIIDSALMFLNTYSEFRNKLFKNAIKIVLEL